MGDKVDDNPRRSNRLGKTSEGVRLLRNERHIQFHRMSSGRANLIFAASLLPLAVHAQVANISLYDYQYVLTAQQKEDKIISIANEDASFYEKEKAAEIKDFFHVVHPGYRHSIGVDVIDELVREAAAVQNVHSALLNALIGKYIVGKYGPPPPSAQK